MTSLECWNHHKEENDSERKCSEEVWIYTDERVDSHEGERMCCLAPTKQAKDLVLKDKDNTYTGVEFAEIVGHDRYTEGRPSDICE